MTKNSRLSLKKGKVNWLIWKWTSNYDFISTLADANKTANLQSIHKHKFGLFFKGFPNSNIKNSKLILKIVFWSIFIIQIIDN